MAFARLICAFASAVLVVMNSTPARAESFPVYGPDKLAAYSDLVVSGTETPDGTIRIQRIMKGHWPKNSIALSGIDLFRKSLGPFGKRDAELKFTDLVVVFVDLRRKPRIVHNGLYHVGTVNGRSGVFGYWQPINPGGYFINPTPRFDELNTLLRETRLAVEAIPAMQRELLDRIKKDDRVDRLSSLARATRKGDLDVIIAVSRLQVTDNRPARRFYSFYLNVHEPAAWPFVAQLFEETGDTYALWLMGQLGHPDSHAYLAKTLTRKPSAMQGLAYLHQALVKRKDVKNARLVAQTIFEWYAADKKRQGRFLPAFAIGMQYRLEHVDEYASRQMLFHHFEGREVTDAFAREALKKLKFIRELSFQYTATTDSTLVALAELKDLEELTFWRLQAPHEVSITDAGLKHLKDLSKLRILSIPMTEITTVGLAHLTELKDLEELNLWDTKVDQVSHLKGLKGLKTLVLGRTRVNDSALADLSGLDRLDHLSLTQTPVGDAGLKHLQTLQRLRVLGLSGTNVSDKGLESLRHLKNLEHLHLSGTRVTDDGLHHLHVLKNLKWLSLKGCNVTADGISHLKQQLPKLRTN